LTQEAIAASHQVSVQSHALSLTIGKLAEILEKLGALSKKLKIPSQAKLFSKLAVINFSAQLNILN
jgi:hypothetical protein